jgi:hypothetical protein
MIEKRTNGSGGTGFFSPWRVMEIKRRVNAFQSSLLRYVFVRSNDDLVL